MGDRRENGASKLKAMRSLGGQDVHHKGRVEEPERGWWHPGLDEGKKAGGLVICKEAVLAQVGLIAQKWLGCVSPDLIGLKMGGFTMLERAAPGQLYLYRR